MLRLFVPSKTFLLGEYAVLHGGAALVATTRPEFIVDMDFVVRPSSEGVRFAGPAGRLHENLSLSSGLRIQQFLDPHFGKGGFGASSAQYISVYLAPSIDKVSEVHPVPISLARAREMVAQFQTDSHALGNGRPSGVDLVAQWLGGMAQVEALKTRMPIHEIGPGREPPSSQQTEEDLNYFPFTILPQTLYRF